jgi:hypothetical protein
MASTPRWPAAPEVLAVAIPYLVLQPLVTAGQRPGAGARRGQCHRVRDQPSRMDSGMETRPGVRALTGAGAEKAVQH